MSDLADINMVNGVNENGEGFITVVATSTDRQIMVGQLSPAECRAHALAYLEAAEAAEQDAAVLRVMRKLDGEHGDTMAALIITELRESRDSQDSGD